MISYTINFARRVFCFDARNLHAARACRGATRGHKAWCSPHRGVFPLAVLRFTFPRSADRTVPRAQWPCAVLCSRMKQPTDWASTIVGISPHVPHSPRLPLSRSPPSFLWLLMQSSTVPAMGILFIHRNTELITREALAFDCPSRRRRRGSTGYRLVHQGPHVLAWIGLADLALWHVAAPHRSLQVEQPQL